MNPQLLVNTREILTALKRAGISYEDREVAEPRLAYTLFYGTEQFCLLLSEHNIHCTTEESPLPRNNHWISHSNKLITHIADLLEFIKKLDSPNIQVLACLHHFLSEHGFKVTYHRHGMAAADALAIVVDENRSLGIYLSSESFTIDYHKQSVLFAEPGAFDIILEMVRKYQANDTREPYE